MNCYNPQFSDGMDFRRPDSMSDMSYWYSDQGYSPCGMPPRMIQPVNEANARRSGRAAWMQQDTAVPEMPVNIPAPAPAEPAITPQMGGAMPENQSNTSFADKLNRFPIAMGYVPMQKWSQPSPIEEGFCRGTIFAELDLPFVMGRCM